jgi:hypothetical protein
VANLIAIAKFPSGREVSIYDDGTYDPQFGDTLVTHDMIQFIRDKSRFDMVQYWAPANP